MKTRGWHVLRDAEHLTLARHMPPRFDFHAETVLPPAAPLRLAHQIRQDMWRRLARLRGFSPVVRLDRVAEGWRVRAGGRAAGPVPDAIVARVAALLASPAHRARWVRFADEEGSSTH